LELEFENAKSLQRMEYIIIGVSCTVCTIGIERLNYVICNRVIHDP
jgi:hypothetical protein